MTDSVGRHRHKYELGEEQLERSPAERALQALSDSRLSVSQQHVLAAKRTNPIPGFIKHLVKSPITTWSKVLIMQLYSALVWP